MFLFFLRVWGIPKKRIIPPRFFATLAFGLKLTFSTKRDEYYEELRNIRNLVGWWGLNNGIMRESFICLCPNDLIARKDALFGKFRLKVYHPIRCKRHTNSKNRAVEKHGIILVARKNSSFGIFKLELYHPVMVQTNSKYEIINIVLFFCEALL